ncbi:MAG: transglycosylase SLT domain-containing protein, partial [Bradymonadia bacterium]
MRFVVMVALSASLAHGQTFSLGPPATQSSTTDSQWSVAKTIDLRDLNFDYPVSLEPEVARYLRVFTGESQNIMRGWLARMGLYEDVIYAELKAANCPSDLIGVAMIESGFMPDAYSRAGAVGVWQFMLPTAREMGARIDDWIDERRHIQASTRLAASLLKSHFERFGSWHLALAAYNAGAGAVSRAIRAAGTNDFWEIARQGLLPREAVNYVPKAIAAMIVIRRPAIVKLETVVKLRPRAVDYVSVSGGTDLLELAKKAQLDADELLELNPHLRRGITPPDGEDFALAVPKAMKQRIESWIRKQDRSGGEIFEPVTLRFGERLKEVAWRRQVSLRRLRVWNDVSDQRALSPGERILVPSQTKERSLEDRGLVTLDNGRFEVSAGLSLRYYPVLYDQELVAIADWFDVSTNALRLWNGLSDSSVVKAGLALKIWVAPKKVPPHTLFVSEQDIAFTTSFEHFESMRRHRPSAIKVIKHRVRKG